MSEAPECYHRSTTHAVSIDRFGNTQEHKLYLCVWPEGHPEFFINAPGWLTRLVGGGAMIRPEEHCVRCPGFCKLAGKPVADK